MQDSIFIKPGKNVLVDTNPVIMDFLKLKAKSLGVDLVTYEEPDDFLKDIGRYDKDTAYFFGYRFGPFNIDGVQMAERVRRLNEHTKIVLITIFPRSDFKKPLEENMIDEVLDKGVLLGEPVNLSALTPYEMKDYYADLGVLVGHYDFFEPKTYRRMVELSRLRIARERRDNLETTPIVEEVKAPEVLPQVIVGPITVSQPSPNWFMTFLTWILGFRILNVGTKTLLSHGSQRERA
jgi:hypothetical protein